MFGSGRGANRATGADKSLSSAAEPGKAVKAGTAAGAHQLRSGLTKAHFELGQDGKPKQVYPTTPLSGGNVKLEPTALGLVSPAAAGAVKAPIVPSAPSKSSVSASSLPAAGAGAPKPEVAPVAPPPGVLAAAAAGRISPRACHRTGGSGSSWGRRTSASGCSRASSSCASRTGLGRR
jgi:hypothetical protein